jgi:hypothetical protein
MASGRPPPGYRLGRFEIQRELGRGGMGVVYEAFDPELRRSVAIKVLPTETSHRHAERLERFVAEAQLTSQLQHPNIVPVHDVGEGPEGLLYFVMKKVEGRSLKAILAEPDDEWTPAALLRAFVQVCNAVAFAHDRGVLHRDLKPANVMLGAFGEVLVMDWGVARLLEAVEEPTPAPAPAPTRDSRSSIDRVPVRQTIDGSTVGSPGYMSPEQARGERDTLSPAADVFGLGAMLYEIVAGAPAVPGDDLYQLLYATVSGAIEDPRERFPDRGVPDDLAAAAMAALELDPAERTGSAAELGRAVSDFLDGARRRERADGLYEAAVAADAHERSVVARLERARARRDALAERLPSWAPVDEKADLIAAWEAVDALEAERPIAFAEVVRLSEGALTQDPSHRPASDLLADAWMRRFDEADAAGDRSEAALAAARVTTHDVGRRHAARLTGDGSLTLHTAPAGAEVWC